MFLRRDANRYTCKTATTPGGVANTRWYGGSHFWHFENGAARKKFVKDTILREACGDYETGRKDRHVSLECNRTKEVI
jgi:hypothetical protein